MKNKGTLSLTVTASLLLVLTPGVTIATSRYAVANRREVQFIAPPRTTERYHSSPYYNKRDKFNRPYVVLPPPHRTFTGFFAGISGGAITGDSTNQTDISNDISISSERLLIENKNLNNTINPVVNIQLGYSHNFKPFYLGALVFGQFGKEKNSGEIPITRVDAATLDYEFKNKEILENRGVSFGARLRGGFVIKNDFLAYLTVGYVRTSYKITSFTDYTEATLGDAIATVDLIKGCSLNGIQFGLGIEKAFNSSISISAEYLYTIYPTINLSGSVALSTSPTDFVITSTSISPKNQVVLLGINYYWST